MIQIYSESNIEVGKCCSEIVGLYENSNDLDNAESFYQKSLYILCLYFDYGNPIYLSIINHLVDLNLKNMDQRKAISTLELYLKAYPENVSFLNKFTAVILKIVAYEENERIAEKLIASFGETLTKIDCLYLFYLR